MFNCSAFCNTNTKGIAYQLTTEVVVIKNNTERIKATALWDTGATGTCVSHEVVKSLNLVPVGIQPIHTPSGNMFTKIYIVDIHLPNNVVIPDVKVIESEIGTQGLGVLIGMDIITKGDFCVNNYNGITSFTFRIPSLKKTDYAQEINVMKITGTHGKGKRRHK